MEDYYYPARTLKLMNYLTHLGFDVVMVKDSKENARFKTFYFVETPELREQVDKYMQQNS